MAWLGDAILALYTREWLLEAPLPKGCDPQQVFPLVTSNQFLSGIEEPTRFEARIGKAYKNGGLAEAVAILDAELKPRLHKQVSQLKQPGKKSSK